jgi:hypothetical protein
MTPIITATRNRAELRGRASGMIVLGYFALAWTGWGASAGVPAGVQIALVAVAALAFAALVAGAVLMFRQARALPEPDAAEREEGRRAGRRIGIRFGIVVVIEFAGIAVIARVLAITGRTDLIPLLVCLGVGVHFFPLARLFRLPVYDRTGIALCAVAVATALAAPLLGLPILWTLLPGLGAALVLFATSGAMLRAQRLWRPTLTAHERGMPQP